MNVLFWGTPQFAVSSLRALAEEGHEVVGVVTQPDRPAGRGRALRPSPVKRVAMEEGGYPVLCPERPRGDDFLAAIRVLAPDLSVVVAYGHILRKDVLAFPPFGSVNLHASLLPELRGAAPINRAIVRGYEVTGVTVMRVVEQMDAGPVLFQVEEPIGAGETASELAVRLSEIGAAALVEALALLQIGALEECEQDESRVTFAPKVDRETARIDWALRRLALANHVRGMDEVPGAWTVLRGEPVKLFRPELSAEGGRADPGVVVRADPVAGLAVATVDGVVTLGEVQPQGRRRMAAADWVRGRGVAEGDRFE